LSEIREKGAYKCGHCHKDFNKNDLIVENNNVYWPGYHPETGVCDNVNKIFLFIFIS